VENRPDSVSGAGSPFGDGSAPTISLFEEYEDPHLSVEEETDVCRKEEVNSYGEMAENANTRDDETGNVDIHMEGTQGRMAEQPHDATKAGDDTTTAGAEPPSHEMSELKMW